MTRKAYPKKQKKELANNLEVHTIPSNASPYKLVSHMPPKHPLERLTISIANQTL